MEGRKQFMVQVCLDDNEKISMPGDEVLIE